MPERIAGPITPLNTQSNTRINRQEGSTAPPRAAEPDAGSGDAQRTDSVSLTESARLLSELSSEAAAGEAVDMGRVESVRQALDEGVYQIDPRQIAERLLALDDSLGA